MTNSLSKDEGEVDVYTVDFIMTRRKTFFFLKEFDSENVYARYQSHNLSTCEMSSLFVSTKISLTFGDCVLSN